MTVFEKLEADVTGMRREDEFGRVPISVGIESLKTGEVRPGQYAWQTEHELRLRLFARFWANSAEYHQARTIAERTIANLLYNDVIVALDGIMHAISDGDRRAALTRCGDLRASLLR